MEYTVSHNFLNASVIGPFVCHIQSVPVHATSKQISSLLAELKQLRASSLAMEQEFGTSITEACPQSRHRVQNLLHYLALRQHDLRDLQSRLAALGLSSLGRSEPNVLAELKAVITILQSLAGEQRSDPSEAALLVSRISCSGPIHPAQDR